MFGAEVGVGLMRVIGVCLALMVVPLCEAGTRPATTIDEGWCSLIVRCLLFIFFLKKGCRLADLKSIT